MAVFHYIAKDRQGMALSGNLEADILQQAISVLHNKELVVISVKEENTCEIKERSVSLDELAIFTRELAAMVGAGITIVRALRILCEQTENKMLAAVTLKLREDVLGGANFCDAIGKHPRIFSPLYSIMVKTGEISGNLKEILVTLAVYLEKAGNLQRRIRAAMVYPSIIVIMAALITAVLLIKVVPTFEGIFKTLGGELPLATQMLLMVSTIFRKYLIFAVILIVALLFCLKKYSKTPSGREMLDRRKLWLPVFGPLIRKVAIARFARTFATTVKSAVPLLTALDIVAKTSENKIIEKAVAITISDIRNGESISGGLAKNSVFPPMVTGMIGIGESTGQLSDMLTTIADLYEQQVDSAVDGLTAMIEPLVIGFLGIIIGGIVLALFMPVFTISQLIH
ncbi:MAG TPA: pilus assembly protein PilC [Candidatus Omnitrophica bacterium]|nr:pilus assembly protein PilC [Candidatus Omnitrophota bacterium]